MSGSMRRDIREVAAIAGDVLKQVRAGDQVGVMSFVMRARLECPLTQDIASVVSTIRRVASAGTLGAGTRLIAPISSALHVLADQPGAVPSRDAILIITDNIPAPEWTDLNFEFTPDAVIIRDLLETNSILNAIVVHRQRIGKRGPPPRDNPTAALYTQENVFHIAEATGGDAIISARMRDSFPDMLARIRARYSIWYRPPEAKPGAFRLIRVSLSDGAQQRYPRATIRARTGYYAQ